MTRIDTDAIAGFVLDGIWSPPNKEPYCALKARIGTDDGPLETLALLDRGEVEDLISDLRVMQAALERKEQE